MCADACQQGGMWEEFWCYSCQPVIITSGAVKSVYMRRVLFGVLQKVFLRSLFFF